MDQDATTPAIEQSVLSSDIHAAALQVASTCLTEWKRRGNGPPTASDEMVAIANHAAIMVAQYIKSLRAALGAPKKP